MGKRSKAENGRLRLAIFKRYGVLVEATNGFPEKLPPRSQDPDNETYKSWCERVLRSDVVEVAFFAHSLVTPQTSMKRLQEASPGKELAEILIAQHQATELAAAKRLERAKRNAEAKLEKAARDEARIRGASDGLARRTRNSRLEKLAADLERWVDGNPDLDGIVRARAQGVLDGLEQGRPVASLIQDVLLFAQRCRTELARSTIDTPPIERTSTD